MKKKYLVVGGEMTSKADGQRYYVSPVQLVHLYRVDPRECIMAINSDDARQKTLGMDRKSLIYLGPRYDGNYLVRLVES